MLARVGVQISAQGEAGCSQEVDAGRGGLRPNSIGTVSTWTPFSRMTGKIIQVRRPGLPGRVAGMGWTTAATEAPSSTARTWTGCGAIQVEGVPVASTGTGAPICQHLTWTDSRQSAVRRTSARRWSTHPDLGRSGRWGLGWPRSGDRDSELRDRRSTCHSRAGVTHHNYLTRRCLR